jgi:hypothetical protein
MRLCVFFLPVLSERRLGVATYVVCVAVHVCGGGCGCASVSFRNGIVTQRNGGRAVEDEGRKGPCLILAMERDSGVSRLQVCVRVCVCARASMTL